MSWVLIVGYVLTTSVYAYTFGAYVSHVVGGDALVARLLAVGIMLLLVGVNVVGVGEAAWLEVVTVWGKLAVLGALAAVGIARWAPERFAAAQLAAEVSSPALGVVFGAAAVFMAYEGFQLLTYDYEDLRDPDRTLPRAVLPAVAVVVGVYVAVTLAALMLVGAGTLIEEEEVALAAAGRAAAGAAGTIAVSVAAGSSAASAINATLFATARLTRRVADDGDLPGWLAQRSSRDVPARAVVVLGAAGTAFAVVGTLGTLVEAASLTFLLTFAAVGAIAARSGIRAPAVACAGAGGSLVIAAVAVARLVRNAPAALAALAALAAVVAAALVGQRLLHRTAFAEGARTDPHNANHHL